LADVVSRRPAIITQADVARAIRAAQQCGAGAAEIKPDGTIRVEVSPLITAGPPEAISIEPLLKVVL
jgi:hypothetical protein